MILNYLDKSAKVIRFKVRKNGSEGKRREEFRHSLGDSSCHLQDQSLLSVQFAAVATAKSMESGCVDLRPSFLVFLN